MKLQRFTNRRGNILLFTVILILPLMLVFAGLTSDLAYFGSVDNDLQRAMDAAALAVRGSSGSARTIFPLRGRPPNSTPS
jgi:Flp pilus assembly protein TadG